MLSDVQRKIEDYIQHFSAQKSQLSAVMSSHSQGRESRREACKMLADKLLRLLSHTEGESEGFDLHDASSNDNFENSRKNWKKNLEIGGLDPKRCSQRWLGVRSKRQSLFEDRRAPFKRPTHAVPQKMASKSGKQVPFPDPVTSVANKARRLASRSFLVPTSAAPDNGYNISLFPVKPPPNEAPGPTVQGRFDGYPANGKPSISEMLFRKDAVKLGKASKK